MTTSSPLSASQTLVLITVGGSCGALATAGISFLATRESVARAAAPSGDGSAAHPLKQLMSELLSVIEKEARALPGQSALELPLSCGGRPMALCLQEAIAGVDNAGLGGGELGILSFFLDTDLGNFPYAPAPGGQWRNRQEEWLDALAGPLAKAFEAASARLGEDCAWVAWARGPRKMDGSGEREAQAAIEAWRRLECSLAQGSMGPGRLSVFDGDASRVGELLARLESCALAAPATSEAARPAARAMGRAL